MSWRRGTTPAIPLIVESADLTAWTVYVTFTNAGNTLTVTNDRIEMEYANGNTTIMVPLTQEETLSFKVGACEIQVRAIHDGTAIATTTVIEDVEKILLDGVIHE